VTGGMVYAPGSVRLHVVGDQPVTVVEQFALR
jgi:hypothetical protein